MATTKKKPTAAQLKARKLFAERARAGTLRKKTAKKTAVKKVVAKKVVRKTAVRKVVKKNPVAPIKSFFGVYDGDKLMGAFRTVEAAKQYAQALADLKGKPYGIRKL